MSDELGQLRRIRPDRVYGDDPPDPEVLAREKERLMFVIDAAGGDVGERRRTPSIYPRLAYQDEVAALEFLTKAFGLTERREARMEQADGMLAWLEIGDGLIMIGRSGENRHGLASPLEAGASTAMIHVYVPDVEAHYRRAKVAGARIVMELEDMFWGDRRYEATDPEGHRWHFAQRVSDMTRQLDK